MSGSGRLLGQHLPCCILGEACLAASPGGRGESTSSDETILAETSRYVYSVASYESCSKDSCTVYKSCLTSESVIQTQGVCVTTCICM